MQVIKKKKLVIIGTSAFAEIAYEYFTADSEYEVVAFSVSESFVNEEEFFGKPVVPFEKITTFYPPETHEVFVAMVYKELNRQRTKFVHLAKSKGYVLASYVSSRSFVWRNVKIGEHCFIFENNTIQPFVEIGDNVILWSGNHIGHHSKIFDNCFISSHVVVSGMCVIKENCFLAVNSCVADRVTIEKDCFVNSGAVVMKSIPENTIMNSAPSDASLIKTAKELFKADL